MVGSILVRKISNLCAHMAGPIQPTLLASDRSVMGPVVNKAVLSVVRQYWGFTQLRSLQAEAIEAGVGQRDSLVVLPTGGGKSLCYQVPPILAKRTDVVVSPLISLMKDQVDALRSCDYPAIALHSGLDSQTRGYAESVLRTGKIRLLFVAPERLMSNSFLQLLKIANVRSFVVDEAHCISHWGHDFRPEYRQLAALRRHFPEASLHAFTATATPRVRQDIIDQLELVDPTVLVGSFDRPNLVYRILPQVDLYAQALDVVRRHQDEAVIIYCLSRNDTEVMASVLESNGIKASFYHAGMDPENRRRTQEAFAAEQLNIVVATVAFGMGIDRSNVRCVLHTTMPKSIEHYQQETGRAGRDGLEAECVLLYSAADVIRWKSLIRLSAEKADQSEEATTAQEQLIRRMQYLCNSPICRHKRLSEYFGQLYDNSNCQACDVCLNEVEGILDGTIVAQKILSCIARTGQRFGVGHVVDVLLGAKTEQVRRCGHDRLSTYGLLKELPKKQLISMVYQLVDQSVLERTEGDRPVLRLNQDSWQVMRGKKSARLLEPKKRATPQTQIGNDAWNGVNRDLFDQLRDLRKQLASDRGVPPYIVFEDSTLRQLARIRPTTHEALQVVRGIGQKRSSEFGQILMDSIGSYCRDHQIEMNVGAGSIKKLVRNRANPQKEEAFRLFAEGRSVSKVAIAIDRAPRTTVDYLVQWIELQAPRRIQYWVHPSTYKQVARAIESTGKLRLKPISERLGGQVPYDTIRLVLAHLRATSENLERVMDRKSDDG